MLFKCFGALQPELASAVEAGNLNGSFWHGLYLEIMLETEYSST